MVLKEVFFMEENKFRISPSEIDYKESFGKQLNYLRKQWAKMTMIELSKRSHLSQSYISQLENGKNPSLDALEKLAWGLSRANLETHTFEKDTQLYEFLLYYEVLTVRLNDERQTEFKKSIDNVISHLPTEDARRLEGIKNKLLRANKISFKEINLNEIFSDNSPIKITLNGLHPLDSETKNAFKLLTIGAIEKLKKKEEN